MNRFLHNIDLNSCISYFLKLVEELPIDEVHKYYTYILAVY